MTRRTLGLLSVVVCLAAADPARAQATATAYSTPAHVSAVEGTAVLVRNGQSESLTENQPLLEGDRLRTERGRSEVVLPDSSVLAVDDNSTLDLLAGGLVRLLGGRIVFVVSRAPEGSAQAEYRVDSAAGSVRLLAAGEYRVSTAVSGGAGSVEVAVVRGEAAIDASGAPIAVRAGRRVTVTEGQGVTASLAFNSAYADAFYVWADGLRADRVGSRSTAYLPADLQVYSGSFDRGGSWESEPDYGPVWYPRVSDGWRPYYDGAWQPYGWGWTWVGGGAWTWPTHHYGRWGHGVRGWYWIPGAVWGPAWVSWGFASDYVGWCPLGWDDSPVFGLSFGFSFGSRFSPWLGWTVVPGYRFGHASRVSSFALYGEGLRAVERSSFAVRRSGPAVTGVAVPRQWGAAPENGRPAVAVRRWSNEAQSPYDRAEAVARQRGVTTSGPAVVRGGSAGDRPTVAGRRWADDPESAYGRAQGVAAERLRQAEPGAAARSRYYDTRPFASPSQSPLPYPDRFRSTVGPPSRRPDGAAIPRSEFGPGAYSPAREFAAPRQPSYPSPIRPGADRAYDRRGYAPPSYAPRADRSPGGQGPRAYSAPSQAPRSYAQPRSGSSSAGAGSGRAPSSGGGGRTRGGRDR